MYTDVVIIINLVQYIYMKAMLFCKVHKTNEYGTEIQY